MKLSTELTEVYKKRLAQMESKIKRLVKDRNRLSVDFEN